MKKVVIVEYIDGVLRTHKDVTHNPVVKDGIFVKISKFKGEEIITPLSNIREIRTLNTTEYDKQQT